MMFDFETLFLGQKIEDQKLRRKYSPQIIVFKISKNVICLMRRNDVPLWIVPALYALGKPH